MNNFIKILTISIWASVLINCGGNTAETNQAANANSAVVQNQSNSLNSVANESAKSVVESNAAVNAVSNAKVTDPTRTESVKLENPAPDDSTILVEMNEKGFPVEARTFKSHPVLAKIEKITLSPREYVYKIHLKNGKVIESKSEELKDFRVIAPANILDAVGMLPPPPKPDPNAPQKTDKTKPVLIPRANQ